MSTNLYYVTLEILTIEGNWIQTVLPIELVASPEWIAHARDEYIHWYISDCAS